MAVDDARPCLVCGERPACGQLETGEHYLTCGGQQIGCGGCVRQTYDEALAAWNAMIDGGGFDDR